MADVKWIKFIVGTFDGDSFKRIRNARIGGEKFRDKLTAVWFELLELAGKSNHGGMLIDSNEMPYQSIEDIAIMIYREPEEVELCMQFYLKEKMIEIIDNIYLLSNWERYQNVKGLDDIREQTRLRVAKHRQNKKLLQCNVTSNDTVTQLSQENKNIDKELDRELDLKESKKESNKEIILNNSACESYDEILNNAIENGFIDISVKSKIIEFIKHLQLNGKKMINSRLESLIVRLDLAYPNNADKIQSINRAINGGYFSIDCEVMK